MKIRRQNNMILKTGKCYVERFGTCRTCYGKGKVQRFWLEEELLGYRVTAGDRGLFGDICITLKGAIDSYEIEEKRIRDLIKKEMV